MNNLICNPTSKPWSTNDLVHSELITSRDLIICSEPVMESESIAYGAYMFKLNSMNVRFRVAKITPTKIG